MLGSQKGTMKGLPLMEDQGTWMVASKIILQGDNHALLRLMPKNSDSDWCAETRSLFKRISKRLESFSLIGEEKRILSSANCMCMERPSLPTVPLLRSTGMDTDTIGHGDTPISKLIGEGDMPISKIIGHGHVGDMLLKDKSGISLKEEAL